MASIIALVVEWQLAHPDVDVEECRQWLLSEPTRAEVEVLLSKFVKKPFVKKKGKQQQQQG